MTPFLQVAAPVQPPTHADARQRTQLAAVLQLDQAVPVGSAHAPHCGEERFARQVWTQLRHKGLTADDVRFVRDKRDFH